MGTDERVGTTQCPGIDLSSAYVPCELPVKYLNSGCYHT